MSLLRIINPKKEVKCPHCNKLLVLSNISDNSTFFINETKECSICHKPIKIIMAGIG